MQEIGEPITFFEDGSGIVAMDIDDSDRYIAAVGSNGKACMYDRENKEFINRIEEKGV